MLNRGGPLSKLVSGTVGLAKEYKADSATRQAAAAEAQATKNESTLTPTSNNTASREHQRHQDNQLPSSDELDPADEQDFILDWDEALCESRGTAGYAPNTNVSKDSFDTEQTLQRFLDSHPPPYRPTGSLSSYVLLPQRRPKSQHKGFVRAYAPELGRCGIDQDSWLKFLDGFEKSINKSPWFHATNAGVFVAGNAAALSMGISPVLHLASTAIHVSVETARRGYLNHEQNRYLDDMNEKFFKPRNLYCMIVKCAPSSDEIADSTNLEDNVSASIDSRQKQSKWKRPFSSSSLDMPRNLDMPPPALLVFPPRDSESEGKAPSSNAFKNFGRVLQNYQDNRAAAKFEAENPGTRMPQAPRQEFASAYGDPNSATNSGGFISMISKGERSSLGPRGGLGDRIKERREARTSRRKEKRASRPLNKLIRSDALYLMVTNLPSQEVVDRVAMQLEQRET